MAIQNDYELTPKEHLLMEYDKDENRLSREHAIRMKELEIAMLKEKNAGELELRKLEAKWSSWLRLPSMIIKWPLYIFFGIAYIIESLRGDEPPKKFWDYIK